MIFRYEINVIEQAANTMNRTVYKMVSDFLPDRLQSQLTWTRSTVGLLVL
jgi:putative lipoic acid-binding regulatory protein